MNALTITPTDDQAAVLVAMNARANAGAPPNEDGTPAIPVKDEDFATTQIGAFLDTLVKNERSTTLQNVLQAVQQVAATGTIDDLAAIAGSADQAKQSIAARQAIQPSPPILIKPEP